MAIEDVRDEIVLVASVIDKLLLTHDSLRADQLAPLTKRLNSAAATLMSLDHNRDSLRTGLTLPATCGKLNSVEAAAKKSLHKTIKKPCSSSERAPVTAAREGMAKAAPLSTTRAERTTSNMKVSKEVAQSLCCSLYNILEGAVNLLQASHGHIFVKNGDYISSIANVSRKLTFPPQQISSRCLGNVDAEVLGSSIALNRYMQDAGKKSALLIFPIFPRKYANSAVQLPIATIHVERKEHSFGPFTHGEECVLYFAAMLCGELIGRVPYFDWLSSFYDPVTQHIVAPFVPFQPLSLPPLEKLQKQSLRNRKDASPVEVEKTVAGLVSQLSERVDAQPEEVLIRRERLPSHSTRAFAPGMTHMPSLLEIQAYVDNLQSCWKKNMTESIDILEEERGTQQTLKTVRNALVTTQRQLAAAREKLRLSELESKDYKFEYGALKSELDTYMEGLDSLH